MPLGILTIVGLYAVAKVTTTDHIFEARQHVGLTLLAVSFLMFFLNRKIYTYIFGILLLLGLLSIVGFTVSIVVISFFGVPMQLPLVPIIVLYGWVHRQAIEPMITKVVRGSPKER